MHISDQCHAPYTCYILRCPPSPTLFMAGVRRSHLVTLLEAISLTLNSVGYVEMDLTGKHLFSLIELVCNQYSQVSTTTAPPIFKGGVALVDTPFNLFSIGVTKCVSSKPGRPQPSAGGKWPHPPLAQHRPLHRGTAGQQTAQGGHRRFWCQPSPNN